MVELPPHPSPRPRPLRDLASECLDDLASGGESRRRILLQAALDRGENSSGQVGPTPFERFGIVLEHAGDPPIEQKVVIKESEKARRIGVSWEPPNPTGPADGSGGTGTIVLQPTAPRKGPPTGAWVLLGTGAAAMGCSRSRRTSRRSALVLKPTPTSASASRIAS